MVIIRLARNLSRSEAQEHIRDLLKRMHSYILEDQTRALVNPFDNVLQGGQSQTVTLSTGKKIHIALLPGQKTEAFKTSKGFRIHVSPQIRRDALHRFLWKLIARSELLRVTSLVARINQETFFTRIRPPRLRFTQSQWGSCSPRGVICLNTALLFLPPSVLKYIIVHELAHTVHRNHSRAYWREVSWAMPSYEKAKKLLEEYRLPLL